MPDSFVSCKNASNEPNFIKIGGEECILDNYLLKITFKFFQCSKILIYYLYILLKKIYYKIKNIVITKNFVRHINCVPFFLHVYLHLYLDWDQQIHFH